MQNSVMQNAKCKHCVANKHPSFCAHYDCPEDAGNLFTLATELFKLRFGAKA
jgi:hypothetical protein